ncbi:MAG: hypothetical protein SGPRY_003243 [Prymnesium sp.]
MRKLLLAFRLLSAAPSRCETARGMLTLPPPASTATRWWGGAQVHSALQFLHPHSDFAHRYWADAVQAGDTVVDATAGNGHDTAALARFLAARGGGTLYACDVQPAALQASRERTRQALEAVGWTVSEGECRATDSDGGAELVMHWIHGSHENLLASLTERSVKLIVFNLGYLPGGDKAAADCIEILAFPCACQQPCHQLPCCILLADVSHQSVDDAKHTQTC